MHCWHGHCQWCYTYAPKCYYTCGCMIFITWRYHWITATSYNKFSSENVSPFWWGCWHRKEFESEYYFEKFVWFIKSLRYIYDTLKWSKFFSKEQTQFERACLWLQTRSHKSCSPWQKRCPNHGAELYPYTLGFRNFRIYNDFDKTEGQSGIVWQGRKSKTWIFSFCQILNIFLLKLNVFVMKGLFEIHHCW